MYQELLQVKHVHQQNAASALQRERLNVEQHRDALQRAREQQKNFHRFRLEREQQLFDDIQGEAVKMQRIDQMKQRVAMLHEQEAELQQAILTAQRDLESAKEELAKAEEHYKEAVREEEKFRQFVATLDAEEQRAQDRRQENEVEEIVTSTYGRHRPGEQT